MHPWFIQMSPLLKVILRFIFKYQHDLFPFFLRFSPENKGKINPYHYMPFGHGPRNCVGLRFALVEAKITLINLLQRFKFVKTEETEVSVSLFW